MEGRIGTPIIRISPNDGSGPGGHQPSGRDALHRPPACRRGGGARPRRDVDDLHPILADQGERPAVAREDGPVDVVQAPQPFAG